MRSLRRVSVIEQTAAHLRERLLAGFWKGELPGVLRLAEECDVSKNTVRAAVRQLEQEGLLAPNGHHGRAILPAGKAIRAKRRLQVAVLPHIRLADEAAADQNLFLELKHALEGAGNVCVFTRKSQAELGHQVPRIARMVRETGADVWVVGNGSEELLQWFAAQPTPAMALGGRCLGVPIASVGLETREPLVEVTRRLIRLGHRRIVFLCPHDWREHTPGRTLQAFTAELASHGIVPSEYNVPNWTETPEGLRTLLTSLFSLTPPSAIITEHPHWAVGVLAFLAERGLRVPQHVSVLSIGVDPSHAWRYPPLAHFRWRNDLLVRRIVRWVGAVAQGRGDRNFVGFPMELDPGGTIGPPPKNA